MLQGALRQRQICAKNISSLVGKIISMGLALGPVARFMTRALYAMLESRIVWCDILTVTEESQKELNFG